MKKYVILGSIVATVGVVAATIAYFFLCEEDIHHMIISMNNVGYDSECDEN